MNEDYFIFAMPVSFLIYRRTHFDRQSHLLLGYLPFFWADSFIIKHQNCASLFFIEKHLYRDTIWLGSNIRDVLHHIIKHYSKWATFSFKELKDYFAFARRE